MKIEARELKLHKLSCNKTVSHLPQGMEMCTEENKDI